MKILLIEDNYDLATSVTNYFEKEGYVVEHSVSYAKGLSKISAFEYDIVLLDLMLPDGNGLELLKILKSNAPDSGVIILSAKESVDDKIRGLELGADDYLPKPFHLSELNARIKAIYRRRQLSGNSEISLNEIRIDTTQMEVMVCDTELILTKKEYELLIYLIVNKNRVLTKQSIAEHLWGDYMDSMDSFDFVYQHIKNLRKKITKAGGKDYVKTMYGSGYKFDTKAE